jgi:hypothetical protein
VAETEDLGAIMLGLGRLPDKSGESLFEITEGGDVEAVAYFASPGKAARFRAWLETVVSAGTTLR